MQKHIVWSCLLAAMAAIPTVFSPTGRVAFAQPAERVKTDRQPRVDIRSERSSLTLVERFSKTVRFKERIARVDGFDPEVVAVTALSPTQLRVQALIPGVTTMVVTDDKDKLYTIELFVTGDVRHLQAYIDRFFPKASVQAVAVRDSVVLRGWVTKPAHITELVEIAEQFYPLVLNQMKVGGVQQVLLKIKVIEAQRTKIRQLGMNWAFRNQKSFVVSAPGMLAPLSGFTSAFGGAPGITIEPTSLRDPTISFGIVGNDDAFNGFIEALKQESLLKILAEPELVIMNGRPATLLAGGEFPILVPQSLGTVTIEWREFGTLLEAVPIILDNDTVRLELQPEVSDRDFANAVTVQGTIVPGLTTRRVNTQVEMRFGQTLMIAGLLSTRKTAVVDKIPFFGELPLIGFAFRRERYDETETELVIMVTPELVAPLAKHQVPLGGPGLSSDTPTDREFMIYGFLEVPNYGDGCFGCDAPSYGNGYQPPIDPIPEDSTHSLQISPSGTNRPGSATPLQTIPPAPANPPETPGLVVPKKETPANGPAVLAPANDSVRIENGTASRKESNWWIGAQARASSQYRGPARQAGFTRANRTQPVGDVRQLNPARQVPPLRTTADRPIDRERRQIRSRLIEPRPQMIQP